MESSTKSPYWGSAYVPVKGIRDEEGALANAINKQRKQLGRVYNKILRWFRKGEETSGGGVSELKFHIPTAEKKDRQTCRQANKAADRHQTDFNQVYFHIKH